MEAHQNNDKVDDFFINKKLWIFMYFIHKFKDCKKHSVLSLIDSVNIESGNIRFKKDISFQYYIGSY